MTSFLNEKVIIFCTLICDTVSKRHEEFLYFLLLITCYAFSFFFFLSGFKKYECYCWKNMFIKELCNEFKNKFEKYDELKNMMNDILKNMMK